MAYLNDNHTIVAVGGGYKHVWDITLSGETSRVFDTGYSMIWDVGAVSTSSSGVTYPRISGAGIILSGLVDTLSYRLWYTGN